MDIYPTYRTRDLTSVASKSVLPQAAEHLIPFHEFSSIVLSGDLGGSDGEPPVGAEKKRWIWYSVGRHVPHQVPLRVHSLRSRRLL